MGYCRIYTGEENQILKLVLTLEALSEKASEVQVSAVIPGLGDGREVTMRIPAESEEAYVVLSYPCEEEVSYWDEFSQSMYEAELTVRVFNGQELLEERHLTERFGFCEVRTLGTQFSINGRTTFLRAVEVCPEKCTGFSSEDWASYLTELKERGLNCISVATDLVGEELLTAADGCGMYVKAHIQSECGCEEDVQADVAQTCKEIIRIYGNHPSLALLSGYRREGKSLDENQRYSGGWVEFAVRDRKDYSDAPDTRSNHIEDIKNKDCPTLVTHVGEWRSRPDAPSAQSKYLAGICTREAMEEALRTPKFGGFCLHSDAQVLELPARRMREFSGTVVPLLLIKKYVWSGDETLSATMMIANYGEDRLCERVTVSALDERGQRYALTSNRLRINNGGVMNVGTATIPLSQFTPGQRIELCISIDNTEYRNHYAVWLFADDISVKVPEHVHISRRLDGRTRQLLGTGKKVIYIPKLNLLPWEPGWFSPLASEISSNRERVISGGISCSPEHPALKGFPTEEMADYQWWNLLHNSIPMQISDRLKPGVLVAMPAPEEGGQDRALIFEARVGEGKLLVSAIDLLIQLDRPEARQLYASLLAYAASPRFEPKVSLRLEELE